MKKAILILSITAIFSFSAFAQNSKSRISALPAGIAEWNGENSDKILDNPVIRTRLKNLLGKQSYADFRENWETLNPIVMKGNLLFSSGCLIHGCLHVESAVAIDLKNNTVHAAIYNEVKRIRYFNEKGSQTPQPIADWAKRLKAVRTNKN